MCFLTTLTFLPFIISFNSSFLDPNHWGHFLPRFSYYLWFISFSFTLLSSNSFFIVAYHFILSNNNGRLAKTTYQTFNSFTPSLPVISEGILSEGSQQIILDTWTPGTSEESQICWAVYFLLAQIHFRPQSSLIPPPPHQPLLGCLVLVIHTHQ